MKLEIIETNFTTIKPWIFKLKDWNDAFYFIMNSDFYSNNNLASPITKKELDYLDKGYKINVLVREINDLNVVISFV